MGAESYLLGIDVGGTFTDLALVRASDGHTFYHKTPSTPADPSIAIETGIRELLAANHVRAGDIAYFGHGTTVATNALITGRIAKTALLTTDGFRDVLEIRRQRQPHPYDLRVPKPTPLVPRERRYELRERTYLMGGADVAPDASTLGTIVAALERADVEAVAVCFLHSYHNPAHERTIADALRARLPNAFVCASHEVLAEFREFERLTTTVVNAALGPVMQRYLQRLADRARALGVRAPNILQSNGGVASTQEAGSKPVRTLASGPAAGVTGAAVLARHAEMPDVITFDVGGTSTDVCLIERGRPMIARERQFNGQPVRFPMIDVHSVGAGGGSIAWVDAGGFLHVGPQSAGASPGPACYGLGGTQPTVTDANVVLGRLPPAALLAGRLPIDAALARRSIEEKVAAPMRMSVEDAAQGILTILNENMVQAIRVISVEQGFDPRSFTLLAFGGAGPLLASALSRELGMRRILVPIVPGLLCAMGLMMAEVRSDFSLTRMGELHSTGHAGIAAAMQELDQQAAQWFAREGIDASRQSLVHAIDIRYQGQSHELTIAIPQRVESEASVEAIRTAFFKEHERVYGYAPSAPVQLVTYRVTALARLASPRLHAAASAKRSLAEAQKGSRRAHFTERGGYVECPVYERDDLPRDVRIDGPAIIEQMDATTIVVPGQRALCRDDGQLVLSFD